MRSAPCFLLEYGRKLRRNIITARVRNKPELLREKMKEVITQRKTKNAKIKITCIRYIIRGGGDKMW